MNPLTSIANPFYGNLGVARQVSRLFFPREYNLGGVDLDTIIEESHESELTATTYPVETGALMVDHLTIQPKKLTIRGLLSDINSNEFIDFGITGQAQQMFSGKNTRSSSMWQQLKKVQQDKTLLLVSSNIQSYPNMAIISLSTTQDKDTVGAVFFTAELQEIPQILIEEHESLFEVPEDLQETDTAKNNAPTAKRVTSKQALGNKKPVALPDDASALWRATAL